MVSRRRRLYQCRGERQQLSSRTDARGMDLPILLALLIAGCPYLDDA